MHSTIVGRRSIAEHPRLLEGATVATRGISITPPANGIKPLVNLTIVAAEQSLYVRRTSTTAYRRIPPRGPTAIPTLQVIPHSHLHRPKLAATPARVALPVSANVCGPLRMTALSVRGAYRRDASITAGQSSVT